MASSKLVGILIFMFFFSSCGKDDSSSETPAEQSQSQEPLSLAGNFTFDVSLIMDFEQGQRSEYPIKATLPKDYKWRVAAENLPEGATFEDNILAWQPSCRFSVENGDFIRGYLVRYVRFTWTAEGSDIVLQSNAALLVHKYNKPGKCQETL